MWVNATSAGYLDTRRVGAQSWGEIWLTTGPARNAGRMATKPRFVLRSVEQETATSGTGKGTMDAECVDVGGGSFYIDCIETSNKFACLAEDDECVQPESQWGRMFACSDWTQWREYYSSIPAPPLTLTFANVTVVKKETVSKPNP